jgi:ASC-1-like (ASCH) protein
MKNSIYVRYYSYTYGLSEYYLDDIEQVREQVEKIVLDKILSVPNVKLGGCILADLSNVNTLRHGVDLYNKFNSMHDNLYISDVIKQTAV